MKEKDENEQETLGIKIFQNCRNELYGYFPYPFASVTYESSKETAEEGTDGEVFYFFPEFLLKKYIENPAAVRRGYLHMLLHCLYLHLFEENNSANWNLACDMAAEQIIEEIVRRRKIKGLQLSEERMSEESISEAPVSEVPVSEKPRNAVRQACFGIMNEECHSPSAEKLCEMLENGIFPYTTEELSRAFTFDDHSLWQKAHTGADAAKIRKKWERILAYTARNKAGGQKKAGLKTDDASEDLDEIYRSKYDYRKFLKQFSSPREEVELDHESFDYIFYHFGLEHYGNLPLIEPLEYREVNRLEELVIAIDTSGSCSRETVQKFLGETYAILSEKENFFRKMNVHLIQCDCCIQNVKVIHSREEWEKYSREITIQGRGGTDFRPVFRNEPCSGMGDTSGDRVNGVDAYEY